ncbi:FAD-dependent oxidoreductase [Pseudomethylobacillus aquaticus]|uniref:FAD-dependent oxidoreductase n=1 Tax=Pseudomethylobacillus aquaticus TaxID=2676064 RepID=A0A3N0V6E7_9PROT|nr:hydroxysqualene dehydroxylase HpnE [Pseudomethylobacillus aquaticus]ROH88182.1 FAD-dependent oxidoreductase [Pseudomethylobacillus aquaticus]
MSKHQDSIAIIGGGCAGLTAAYQLAQQGVPVTVYEAAAQLGGRARMVHWQGLALDNGQHILSGAYSHTLRLLAALNVDTDSALLRQPLQLSIADLSLRCPSWLPAPFNLLYGVLAARGLSWASRLAILRLMRHLQQQGFKLETDQPLLGWLQAQHQPAQLINKLWEPLCLAIMNTPISIASAQVFVHVLRDCFSTSPRASDLLLPRVDLTALLADPLAHAIEAAGGKVHRARKVLRLRRDHAGHYVIGTALGEQQHAQVIIAVAPFHVPELLAGLPALSAWSGLCAQFDYQPIYTVYLQYPESTVLAEPMQGLLDGDGQWVFDRGQLYGQAGLLAVVISASGPHQRRSQPDLALAVHQQLQELQPDLAEPLWSKVIAEKRATYSCVPGLQGPEPLPAQHGVFLAGDYCEPDYPATIEAAVRSGMRTAQQLMAQRVHRQHNGEPL